jgi:hypothetical protein
VHRSDELGREELVGEAAQVAILAAVSATASLSE